MARTGNGIAYDREGPRGRLPVVLIHAGVADRRMWDDQWAALTADRDVVRIDLRGFGESAQRPGEGLSPVTDVLDTLTTLQIDRAHVVGASFGAGVAVEVAVSRPEAVDSLLLSAPGGALIAEATPDLSAFFRAERVALERGDIDAAVEANLVTWVDGPHRQPDDVEPAIRERIGRMQRRALEITADWTDVADLELDPPALERLDEVRAPVLVLVGGLDLDAIQDTATRLAEAIDDVTSISWPDVAHLPSMERPADFLDLLREWLTGRG